MRLRPFALLLAPAFLLLGPAGAEPLAPDPVEGTWWGTTGFPTDRVGLGLEFRRNEKGELKAFQYTPVSNLYGQELPGVVARDGVNVSLPDVGMVFTLSGDTLEGTWYPLKAPATLKRSALLPQETPIPEIPKGPGPRWQAKLGASVYAAPEVRDGIAYVGTEGGVMNAVRVSDGSFVWMFAAGRPIHGAALATDAHLYFVCDNGFLFKLDRKTAAEVWRYDLGDARVSRVLGHQVLDKLGIGDFDWDATAPRPVLDGGVVYVGSGDGSFHAVDAATGKRVWRWAAGKAPEPTPWNKQASAKVRTDAAVDAVRVYFASFDHHVRALDRKSGALVWDKDTHSEVTGAPVLVGNALVVGTRGGVLYALDPATGARTWAMVFWGSSVESTAAPVEGSLFAIGSSDMRRISLIDAKDGRVVWRTDVYGWAWARPAVAGDTIFASACGGSPYFIRHVGGLSAIDAKTGVLKWRWPSPEAPGAFVSGFEAPPVVAGDTVLVGGLDGSLYAFPARS